MQQANRIENSPWMIKQTEHQYFPYVMVNTSEQIHLNIPLSSQAWLNAKEWMYGSLSWVISAIS